MSQIPSPGSGMYDNLKLLDFVSKGDLPSEEMIKYQNKLRSRDTAILFLIMGAGIKSSECVELNIQDLDLEHNYITIRSRREPNRISISSFGDDHSIKATDMRNAFRKNERVHNKQK